MDQRSYDWAFDMGSEMGRTFGINEANARALNPFSDGNPRWRAYLQGFNDLQRKMVK